VFRYVFILIISFSAIAQNDLYIVDSPDIAEPGEYWEPTGSGWGITINVQKTNTDFASSGYFLQGEVYTYKEDGTPVWYIFQGDYKPNSDVYAWREGRGPLASFESPIGISQNGGCLDCDHSPNSVSITDKGNIKLEWSDPITMTMTVNGVTKTLKNMFYHDGLNNNSADFITERLFFVHGVYSSHQNTNYFNFLKGVALFRLLENNEFLEIQETNQSGIDLDSTLSWYLMKNSTLDMAYTNEYRPLNVFEEDVESYQEGILLLGYDDDTGYAYVYPGTVSYWNDKFNYNLSTCNNNQTVAAFVGLLRPAKAQTSRFYYNSDDPMSLCSNEDANNNWKRQQFIDLTGLPVGFDDLSNVPFMLEKPTQY